MAYIKLSLHFLLYIHFNIFQVPVSTEKTKAMATKINAYAYVECSAKIQQGVQDVFETAAKAALNKNRSIMRIDLPRRCPIL